MCVLTCSSNYRALLADRVSPECHPDSQSSCSSASGCKLTPRGAKPVALFQANYRNNPQYRVRLRHLIEFALKWIPFSFRVYSCLISLLSVTSFDVRQQIQDSWSLAAQWRARDQRLQSSCNSCSLAFSQQKLQQASLVLGRRSIQRLWVLLDLAKCLETTVSAYQLLSSIFRAATRAHPTSDAGVRRDARVMTWRQVMTSRSADVTSVLERKEPTACGCCCFGSSSKRNNLEPLTRRCNLEREWIAE